MVFNLWPSEGGEAEQPVELSLLFPRNGGIPSLLLKAFKLSLLLLRLQGSIWSTSTGKSGLKNIKESHSSVTRSAATLWNGGERMPLTILKAQTDVRTREDPCFWKTLNDTNVPS